jgi:hypothetical protein
VQVKRCGNHHGKIRILNPLKGLTQPAFDATFTSPLSDLPVSEITFTSRSAGRAPVEKGATCAVRIDQRVDSVSAESATGQPTEKFPARVLWDPVRTTAATRFEEFALPALSAALAGGMRAICVGGKTR